MIANDDSHLARRVERKPTCILEGLGNRLIFCFGSGQRETKGHGMICKIASPNCNYLTVSFTASRSTSFIALSLTETRRRARSYARKTHYACMVSRTERCTRARSGSSAFSRLHSRRARLHWRRGQPIGLSGDEFTPPGPAETSFEAGSLL